MPTQLKWPPPGQSSPLSGVVTIDASTDDGDDSVLLNARKTNPAAATHSSDATACKNIKGGAGDKVIIGHGSVALLIAGTGIRIVDERKYIARTNRADWAKAMEAIGDCTSLSLYACHVGADAFGAQLLNELVETVKADVWAPTGLLFLDTKGNFQLEDGAVWQVATKTKPATPISAPASPPVDAARHLVLRAASTKREFDWNDIHRVTIRARAVSHDLSPYTLTLRGVPARRFLQEFIKSKPFRLPGAPIAVVTGTMDVVFGDDHRSQFEILNDRLLRDVKERTTYYHCREPLAHALTAD